MIRHGLKKTQTIETYTSEALTCIGEMIDDGWLIVALTKDNGALIVVYERVETDCGETVNCLACLAQKE